MGWTGYTSEIRVGMLFKRMYCWKCGRRLKKYKESKTYNKGEEGYSSKLGPSYTIGMDRVVRSAYMYICPLCGRITDYDQQLIIQKLQKKYGRYKLTKEEIRKYYDER